MAVERIKSVTPVNDPIISRITGGDHHITIRWYGNLDESIIGYMVYRTDDKLDTHDQRRMKLIKNNPRDKYSVEVLDDQFEYIDNSVEPKRQYYYGIVAVSSRNVGTVISSRIGNIAFDQADDSTSTNQPN